MTRRDLLAAATAPALSTACQLAPAPQPDASIVDLMLEQHPDESLVILGSPSIRENYGRQFISTQVWYGKVGLRLLGAVYSDIHPDAHFHRFYMGHPLPLPFMVVRNAVERLMLARTGGLSNDYALSFAVMNPDPDPRSNIAMMIAPLKAALHHGREA